MSNGFPKDFSYYDVIANNVTYNECISFFELMNRLSAYIRNGHYSKAYSIYDLTLDEFAELLLEYINSPFAKRGITHEA